MPPRQYPFILLEKPEYSPKLSLYFRMKLFTFFCVIALHFARLSLSAADHLPASFPQKSTPVLLPQPIARVQVDYTPIRAANQCLSDAVGFQTALLVQYPEAWSRLLKVTWNTRVDKHYTSHAYCIYEINQQLYAYDSVGGQRRLKVHPAIKYDSDALGAYLGQSLFASASYLAAYDPENLDLPLVLSAKVDAPHRVELRPGDF